MTAKISSGPFGDLLTRSLDELGLAHRPVPIAGDTRESFTVDEFETGLQYRFVLPGPSLSSEELACCLDALTSLDPVPAYLVLSGSFPPGVALTFYDDLLSLTRRIGVVFRARVEVRLGAAKGRRERRVLLLDALAALVLVLRELEELL